MRIGINVPNDLLRRMKPLKGVANTSQICRDAIEAWVEAYERTMFEARENGAEAAAARLSGEHAEHTVDWAGLGREDARSWVKRASVDDFDNLFHNLKVLEREGRSPRVWIIAGIFEGVKTFWNRQGEHREWFYRQYELDEGTNSYERAESEYTRGWFGYVTAVWQMAQGQIAASAQALEEVSQESRRKIELPEHLVISKPARQPH